MAATTGRREAEGDAACVWHCLDTVLLKTREACDALEGNGLDELAEEFSELAERVEGVYGEAEKKILKAMEAE